MGGMWPQALPPQMMGQPGMPFGRPGLPGAAQFMKMPPGPPEMMFGGTVPLPQEQSYLENILRLNRGKVATIYTTNDNNPEWAAKVFRGVVENAARDHVVLADPQTGMRYVVLMVNIDYLTFDEPLNYAPEFYQSPF